VTILDINMEVEQPVQAEPPTPPEVIAGDSFVWAVVAKNIGYDILCAAKMARILFLPQKVTPRLKDMPTFIPIKELAISRENNDADSGGVEA
jgi:hypothetical protein